MHRLIALLLIISSAHAQSVRLHTDDSTYAFRYGSRPLLSFFYATKYPPPGVDTAYRRSGFIHPLYTLNGHVLTRIQPKDHYHHYGLWNPWTQVLFQGDTVDFWNLGDKKGTVRFKKLLGERSTSAYAEIDVLLEHVALKTHTIALTENQTIRVHKPQKDFYAVDITSRLRCATDSPVRLLTYRYGGLGWRTTAEWNKDNSEVLTSEGKDRKDADGSTARWCIVQGALGADYGGMVLMSHPDNYNHPEPLRVWPESSNDLFVNFSPTKNKDWLLEPGKTYTLQYRLIVFDGHFDAKRAEAEWNRYAGDTLTSGVTHAVRNALPAVAGRIAPGTYIWYGSSTLTAGKHRLGTIDCDELVFVKKGLLIAENGKPLGPQGVYLIQAGTTPEIETRGQVTYDYVMLRKTSATPLPGPNLVIDWPDLTVQKNAKGEVRQIFTAATARFQKIDLHATTLNPGETSHPPHVHPEAEIILVRTGDVEELIDGVPHTAKGGDLVLLTPGSPHNIKNTGATPAVYYALQWR